MRIKLSKWIADRLPVTIIYFAVIRAWAKATTGEWSSQDISTVTANELAQRLEAKV